MGRSRLHGNRYGVALSRLSSHAHGGQARTEPCRHGACKKILPDSQPSHGRFEVAVLQRACLVSTVLCGLLGFLVGCEDSRQDPRSNLNDVSYANHRGHPCGPNALDVPVALEDFEGSFLWVDYAAPWCGPCTGQARVMRALERNSGNHAIFLTLMTSGSEPMEEATTQTAAAWAKRHGLDPSRVVASTETSRTIPQHTLFSPLGQTLYHAIGYHTEVQIRATLARHANEWRRLHPEVSTAN